MSRVTNNDHLPLGPSWHGGAVEEWPALDIRRMSGKYQQPFSYEGSATIILHDSNQFWMEIGKELEELGLIGRGVPVFGSSSATSSQWLLDMAYLRVAQTPGSCCGTRRRSCVPRCYRITSGGGGWLGQGKTHFRQG
jgi:hypothetical protein